MRALLRALAAGQRFLNLFGYTGTATVAARPAARAPRVTVDLSQTYLDWARRNLELNGFAGAAHELVRADASSGCARERRRFGLIFLDPPTFSTSNAMRGHPRHPARPRAAAAGRRARCSSPTAC